MNMNHPAARTARPRPGIPARLAAAIQAAGQRASDRAHSAADARARHAGWDITTTPGRSGLTGRIYRDPRFAARAETASRTPTADSAAPAGQIVSEALRRDHP